MGSQHGAAVGFSFRANPGTGCGEKARTEAVRVHAGHRQRLDTRDASVARSWSLREAGTATPREVLARHRSACSSTCPCESGSQTENVETRASGLHGSSQHLLLPAPSREGNVSLIMRVAEPPFVESHVQRSPRRSCICWPCRRPRRTSVRPGARSCSE